MERLVIVGPGRVGLSLGQALHEADAVRSLIYHGRHPDPPEHALFRGGVAEYRYGVERPPEGTTAVLLTVPDHSLREMAELLAARGDTREGTPVLHCSGALGAEPLEALHRAGYQVGTLHPLQAVASAETGARRLAGAAFAVSGEPGALAAGRRLVQALSGAVLSVPTRLRPLYHAAAVLASNYLVVLLREAEGLLRDAGTSQEEARTALLALASGTISNATELGFGEALTGPVVRGDADVLDLHLRTLPEPVRSLYAQLGLRALEQTDRPLPPDVRGAIRDLLQRNT
ncbi:MAG: DUF2520 domain-containing protein [Gemmatimonadales bacterium]|nr:MAG: DUF2520 domain-containing protein [Gemmatimonadales bacterium]